MSILNPLIDLMAWVIMRIHSLLGAMFGPASGWAWGLTIVILVVLIRVALIPLFVKQVHAQRKMAQHAPQLLELKKKYKNDKQRLNEETMKFYKENKVNPLGGCLPMIPQMIVFIALFYVLRAITTWAPGTTPKYGLTVPVVVSARQATIFGVHLYDKLLLPHTPGMGLGPSIVAAITVVLSATTTFMTVRQSAKRGLMQTNMDPDNPMAQSQKYMQYIVPFFSLTGLYWQYGLVLYWVTTNLWTMGQQYFMFRNWDTETVGAEGALGGATIGGPVPTTQRSVRPGSSRQTPARPSSGGAKTTSGGTRTGTSSGRTAAPGSQSSAPAKGGSTAASGSARAKGGSTAASGSARTSGSGAARAGSAARPAAAATGQNGSEKRGLLRLGRPKPEPEPQDDVPTAKVVRQQPVRQARSKRSGKR